MTDKSAILSDRGLGVGTTSERVGIAIVGLGRAGQFHLTSAKALSDAVALRWVIDIDEPLVQRVAEREGCKGSTSIDAALADPSVEAVIIASTTHTHYGHCLAALKAKKHVFTEKPVSHKPEELREVIELAIRSETAFIVGYQRRVDPNFRQLRVQVQDHKALGALRLIKCCSRDNPLPPLEYLRVSGGIFCDMLCHDFDMIHFLSGEIPTEVYSVGHCYNADIAAMDDIDTVVTTLTFASGLIATVDCSRVAAYGYDQRVECFGERGMASAHNQRASTVEVATEAGFLAAPAQFSFPQRYKHTYTAELAEFIALIRAGGVEPEALLRRHLDLDRVTAAAELSWRLHRPVKLDEVAALRSQLPH